MSKTVIVFLPYNPTGLAAVADEVRALVRAENLAWTVAVGHGGVTVAGPGEAAAMRRLVRRAEARLAVRGAFGLRAPARKNRPSGLYAPGPVWAMMETSTESDGSHGDPNTTQEVSP